MKLQEINSTDENVSAMSTAGLNRCFPFQAILFGVFASAITSVLVTQAEIVLSTVRIGYLQLPPVAVVMLVVVLAINAAIRRGAGTAKLTSGDLLIIYCMCLVSAMVSSHGVVQKLVPMLVIPKYYADSSNNWHGLYDPFIRQQLVPYDVSSAKRQPIVDNYYSANTPAHSVSLMAWLTPMISWAVLVLLMLFAFLCLASIVRKQWVDNEKLSFPLAQLPLDMVDSNGEFFRQPALWFGVLIPTIIFSLKAIHLVEPIVPDVTLQWNLADYVTALPWSLAANSVAFNLSFAAIGLFFLLPTDILFSVWFFYILTRLEVAVAAIYNLSLPAMPQFPPPLFVGYQTMGAYVVLAGYFLWSGRAHYGKVWDVALGKAMIDDDNELVPYRVAVWGLIFCIGGAALWLVWAGMSPWLAFLELIVGIFVIGMVMARSTAESGLLMTETTFRPINFYQMFASLHSLGPANLTVLAFFDSLFLRDQRSLLLCGFMDSARITSGTQMPRRNFTAALIIGVITGLLVATVLNVYLPYHIGALKMDSWLEQGNSRWTFTDTSAFAGNQFSTTDLKAQMFGGFGIGIALTILLTVMRSLFFWWPLHPLGYALSGSWSTIQFWFPCMIAWLIKSLILRYGGRSLFVKLRPLFLGLVIGEFGMAVVSVAINLVFHFPVPAFPWN